MPNYVYVTWALLGAVVITVTLLAWTVSRGLKFLRERARREQAEDIMFENEVREKLRSEGRPRRLWVVPALMALAWLRRNPVPMAASAATAGVMGLAVLVPAPAQGREAWPVPVPPAPLVESTRDVAVTPPAVSTATGHLRPAAPRVETPRVPERTTSVRPTTAAPALPTVTPTPATTGTSTPGPREPCLLGLGLLGLDVCVPSL